MELSGCACGLPKCTIPYGECHCGCGKKTWIPKWNDKGQKRIKGIPLKYAPGHYLRATRPLEDSAAFKIDAVYCRLVPLTKGYYAIVDASDYENVMQTRWFAALRNGVYAQRKVLIDGKQKHLNMSNFLLGVPIGQIVDHENGNALDYRRHNLRPANKRQNRWNSKVNSNNRLGLKGVSKQKNCFVARYCDGTRVITVARCRTPEEASEKYQAYAKTKRGKFMRKINGQELSHFQSVASESV